MEDIHHIHEVLHLLYGSDKIYTVQELDSELIAKYGKEVQFTSCSDNFFPVEEVVPFLLNRNKIKLDADRIIPLTPACNH